MYSKRNHCQRNFASWKFRQCEFSTWQNFASANFRYGEISRMRIFTPTKFRQDMTAKSRLTQQKFASALTKFFGEILSNFWENKERKTPCTSFAQYCKRNLGKIGAIAATYAKPTLSLSSCRFVTVSAWEALLFHSWSLFISHLLLPLNSIDLKMK